jgi:RNA-binding protein
MKKEISKKARMLEPIVRIGKNGITDNLIEDLKLHLKKRKLIKVKLLKSFIQGKDRKKIAEELAKKTGSKAIQQIGFVVVLQKEG